ncbi:hypothetical protein [Streptomyces galbus]|uniref:Uncharacterized protein n=1 Tax=Streptomyces galbus TaxID=33898 RepID=A0A4U5X347_STRGB|nr:hypothetical protein [Streptomyces galbus]TKT07756.1 hypothetical protein E4U92_20085 [Streptomyces galbus]
MVDSDDEVTPRRGRFDAVHKWAATAAGVVALAFSLYNFTELQKKPEIDMALPHLMRIGLVGKDTHLYLQPTVSTRIKTQDVEVIRDARFRLTPVGSISSSKRPVFYWKEVGTWNFDPVKEWISYRWSGDPAPFLVSQDRPQQPTFLFQADGWSFQPGRYEGSLELSRSENHNPVTKNFCLIISKKAVDEIRDGASREDIFYWRNDMPKAKASSKVSGCYVREAEWQG